MATDIVFLGRAGTEELVAMVKNLISETNDKVDNVVLYTAQSLTEEQKAQARANIGASAVKVNLDNGVLSIE